MLSTSADAAQNCIVGLTSTKEYTYVAMFLYNYIYCYIMLYQCYIDISYIYIIKFN